MYCGQRNNGNNLGKITFLSPNNSLKSTQIALKTCALLSTDFPASDSPTFFLVHRVSLGVRCVRGREQSLAKKLCAQSSLGSCHPSAPISHGTASYGCEFILY